MPAIARKDDLVLSPTGAGDGCAGSMIVHVYEVNSNQVYANGKLIVVADNMVEPHPQIGCMTTDTSRLNKFSDKVFIGSKGVGRIEDLYNDNRIITGSDNVFSG